MSSRIVPFRIAPLPPLFDVPQICGAQKKCCKKFKKGKRCKKCPGRLKMA